MSDTDTSELEYLRQLNEKNEEIIKTLKETIKILKQLI